jgi:hypothetical protein
LCLSFFSIFSCPFFWECGIKNAEMCSASWS